MAATKLSQHSVSTSLRNQLLGLHWAEGDVIPDRTGLMTFNLQPLQGLAMLEKARGDEIYGV